MNLIKLKKALQKAWDKTREEFPSADNRKHIIKAHVKWHETCASIGMERLKKMGEDRFDPKGEMLENSVVVMDPALYGAWLQISKETAEKILALGAVPN